MHPKVHSSTIYLSQVMETMQALTDRGVDRRGRTIGHCSARKNGIVPSAATGVRPETLILKEESQTEKGKSHTSLKCGL